MKAIRLVRRRAIRRPLAKRSHSLESLKILFDKINIAKYTGSIFMKSSDIQYVSDEKGYLALQVRKAGRIAVIVLM